MKKELVQYVVCPQSLQPLRLESPLLADGEEIESGQFVSAAGKTYPIVNGVPCLLNTADFEPGQKETSESFSEKWKLARDYRETTTAHYQRWYLDRYGFQSLEKLRAFLSNKHYILDAGTGHGRDSAMYIENSEESLVFGIDLSEGIHNAYQDFFSLSRAHFIQADLVHLPFSHDFFDFIACDQVLHHTPDTYVSLKALLSRLKPGGHIAFYVYKVKAPAREFCDDFIRKTSVGMSVDQCMKLSESITAFGRSLAEAQITINVPEDIPLLEIKAGEHDLQRFIYWHMFKCYWNETMSWEANVITNFDWYHPLHAHRHTPEEVQTWCSEQQLEIQHFDVQESGISVLARKP